MKRVAIIGAGPAGFYAAGALLEKADLIDRIDLIEQLFAPYGLVRYGVAPDHPKIKNVIRVYEKVAMSPKVRLLANVTAGRDLLIEELRECYDTVVYAVGASQDRTLGIPGENSTGSVPATTFVAWYNGHPHVSEFNLSLNHEGVVVVGIGNVALDVARILVKNPDELQPTDIDGRALEKLRGSRVRDIHLVARRGPLNAKCTPPELREFSEILGLEIVINPKDLEIAGQPEADSDKSRRQLLEIFQMLSRKKVLAPPRCRLHFHFFATPREILSREGFVTGLRIAKTEIVSEAGGVRSRETDEEEIIPATLIIRAVGYRTAAVPGVPFDEKRGLIPNQAGRVLEGVDGVIRPKEYVVGWAKRGPTGQIGANRSDAEETVALIFEDWAKSPFIKKSGSEPESFLAKRGVKPLLFSDWKLLDKLELERGAEAGRARIKFITFEETMRALEKNS